MGDHASPAPAPPLPNLRLRPAPGGAPGGAGRRPRITSTGTGTDPARGYPPGSGVPDVAVRERRGRGNRGGRRRTPLLWHRSQLGSA